MSGHVSRITKCTRVAATIPPFKPPLGKPRRMKSIYGKTVHFTVEDRISRPQTGYETKMFVLEKIRFLNDNRVEFRFGYYMLGVKPGARGRWVWAQFSPIIPKADFRWIIRQARKRGWL